MGAFRRLLHLSLEMVVTLAAQAWPTGPGMGTLLRMQHLRSQEMGVTLSSISWATCLHVVSGSPSSMLMMVTGTLTH